jgi:hypothetical protein
MALLDPDRKRASPPANPRERLGLEEGSSAKSSTNRVGKMASGTPLGTPQSPMVDTENAGIEDNNATNPVAKPKIKKKEIGVGAYQV